MKSPLRGRILQVQLGPSSDQIISTLESLGFTPEQASDVALAAIKYADEETESFVRQLIPKCIWTGSVVLRRHYVGQREKTWLLLKYEAEKGWNLDSVLFA